MSTRGRKATAPRRQRRPLGAVIDLESARERLRLQRCVERVQQALSQNRQALQRLFETGLVFTRSGTRAGRDLLLAHQHLLRMADALALAAGDGWPGNRTATDLEELFEELDALLEKATAIARRNRSLFRS